ncbi:hypothetical protein UZ36_06820 [Candidatus Nitromaritima sp. SCGC AAA799-C22]|nr:hypothetical protein UZ36_06820 [Candidatus Nitromaritima sp. SCGC AAA799-C22]
MCKTTVTVIGALFILFALENLAIRAILTIKEFSSLDTPAWDLFKIFSMGSLSDFLAFSYFSIPFVLYLTFLPGFLINSRFNKILIHSSFFLFVIFLSFQAHAEWFFWEEFNSRFNFIAVDYLIYTHEVIGNIMESYPMHWVFVSILCWSLVLYFSTKKLIVRSIEAFRETKISQRLPAFTLLLSIPAIVFFTMGNIAEDTSRNRIVRELAKNGAYQFFSAFRNNELDYYTFYKTFEDKQVVEMMRKELSSNNSQWVHSALGADERVIRHLGPEKKYNVMLIVVESLSANYLGTFGNKAGITPHLDKLAKESMLFTHLYAAGNRTVRGLEAITLSIPPTPGFSLIKQPHNENLFSLGKLFASKGYETKFLYGGFGYFDNMNYFFSHNSFQVIDRTNFDDDEISFANVWGIADESLLQKALKEADLSFEKNRPFLNLIMTTSNHRPYTYPEGRIDLPSKSAGRDGGVKYTDYSIGTFLKAARQKPWFDNTLFVIVADHYAGGKGKTEISLPKFHIPMLIYAPKIIKPEIIDTLCNQMDIAPTLAGLLNFTYKTKFFGKDILQIKKSDERLLLGTYQFLGYYKEKILVKLSPMKKVEYFSTTPEEKTGRRVRPNLERLHEAVDYYQYATYLISHDKYH